MNLLESLTVAVIGGIALALGHYAYRFIGWPAYIPTGIVTALILFVAVMTWRVLIVDTTKMSQSGRRR